MEYSARIVVVFFAIFLVIFVGALFFVSHIWLLNYVVAYLMSTVIMFASFFGYKSSIKETPQESVSFDSDEEIIGDKFGLLSNSLDDSIAQPNEKETNNSEKKDNLIKISFSNMLIGSKIFFSLYRVFGYALFIFLTIYLMKNDIWSIGGYIVGIFGTTISLIVIFFFLREKQG